MTREAPDIDATLAPLAATHAPVGFARRARVRFEEAVAARRRRTALTVAAASVTLIVALAVAALMLVAPHVTFAPALDALASMLDVATHLALHAYARNPVRFVALVAELAAVGAVACVALAVFVRREAAHAPVQ